MTFTEAMEQLDQDGRFKSTVAAMNALLMQKGVYSSEEFEAYFLESARNRIRKSKESQASGSVNE